MAERENDPTMRRFALLQLIRFGCIGIVMAGALLYVGRIGDSPPLGAVLIAVGVAGFFFGPRQVARLWKGRDR